MPTSTTAGRDRDPRAERLRKTSVPSTDRDHRVDVRVKRHGRHRQVLQRVGVGREADDRRRRTIK